jgi:hypothetical protein
MYFVIFVTVCSVLAAFAGIWMWALLHCWGNERLVRLHKERWVIFIGLTPPIGALIYFYWHRHDPVVVDLHRSRPRKPL